MPRAFHLAAGDEALTCPLNAVRPLVAAARQGFGYVGIGKLWEEFPNPRVDIVRNTTPPDYICVGSGITFDWASDHRGVPANEPAEFPVCLQAT